ncbi:MAG: sulfite exporter TauE/SafE family protein [Pseudomonadales bacterium]|nr:sulfite exporter TauE/SafE family protein [Pseudomonadales bacterium]
MLDLSLIIPAAILVGIVMGLLGSGGSILTVPILVYLLGQDGKVAIGGSLAIVGGIALFSSLAYIKDKLVDWRSVWLFGIPGMIGTYGGAALAGFASTLIQLMTFGIVMLISSYMMLRPVKVETERKGERHPYKIIVEGSLVGILTGFVGVGGGFLIVPALTILGGLPIRIAIGTSLIIIFLKSSAGFIKYIDVLENMNLQLDYSIIFIFIVVGIAGSYFGKFVSKKIPQPMLKKGFGGFLIIMGGFILTRSVLDFLV